MTDSPKEREDLQFRWQPRANNPHFALIQYLRKNWKYPKEALIETTVAFWLPIACHQTPGYSREQIERIARASIRCLQDQIDYISQELELKNPEPLESQLIPLLANLPWGIQESKDTPDIGRNNRIYDDDDSF